RKAPVPKPGLGWWSKTHAGLVPPYAKTLTTLVAGHALHCGQPLDEIGHDTGMSNNSGDADGTIGSRVTLDEVEVDHLPRSRDADVGREAVFDLSDHRDSHGLGIVLLPHRHS